MGISAGELNGAIMFPLWVYLVVLVASFSGITKCQTIVHKIHLIKIANITVNRTNFPRFTFDDVATILMS